MLVFGHPGVARDAYQCVIFKLSDRFTDLLLIQLHDGMPAGLLVASRYQCIQRQRIVLGCRDLLFYQRAENACLDRVKGHGFRLPYVSPSPETGSSGDRKMTERTTTAMTCRVKIKSVNRETQISFAYADSLVDFH